MCYSTYEHVGTTCVGTLTLVHCNVNMSTMLNSGNCHGSLCQNCAKLSSFLLSWQISHWSAIRYS